MDQAHLIAKLERELAVIFNKCGTCSCFALSPLRLSFVELVVADRLEVEKRKIVELCRKMRALGLKHMWGFESCF